MRKLTLYLVATILPFFSFKGSQETTESSNNTASLQHSGSATNAWLSAHLCAVREVVAKAEARQSSLCYCGRKPTDTSVDVPTVFPSVRVKLVCGADLLESFATTNLWSEEDVGYPLLNINIICALSKKAMLI